MPGDRRRLARHRSRHCGAHTLAAELALLRGHLNDLGAPSAVARHWAEGGAGAHELWPTLENRTPHDLADVSSAHAAAAARKGHA